MKARPVIFAATRDPQLTEVALETSVTCHHGFRRSTELLEACRILLGESGENALAIIDIDQADFGLRLLHLIESARPDFPVVVVGTRARPGEDDMAKPVTAPELRRHVLAVLGRAAAASAAPPIRLDLAMA